MKLLLTALASFIITTVFAQANYSVDDAIYKKCKENYLGDGTEITNRRNRKINSSAYSYTKKDVLLKVLDSIGNNDIVYLVPIAPTTTFIDHYIDVFKTPNSVRPILRQNVLLTLVVGERINDVVKPTKLFPIFQIETPNVKYSFPPYTTENYAGILLSTDYAYSRDNYTSGRNGKKNYELIANASNIIINKLEAVRFTKSSLEIFLNTNFDKADYLYFWPTAFSEELAAKYVANRPSQNLDACDFKTSNTFLISADIKSILFGKKLIAEPANLFEFGDVIPPPKGGVELFKVF